MKCVQNVAPFGNSLAISEVKTTLRRLPGLLLKRSPMYLFFLPPVLAFVGIFAISLRNQFADLTNL